MYYFSVRTTLHSGHGHSYSYNCCIVWTVVSSNMTLPVPTVVMHNYAWKLDHRSTCTIYVYVRSGDPILWHCFIINAVTHITLVYTHTCTCVSIQFCTLLYSVHFELAQCILYYSIVLYTRTHCMLHVCAIFCTIF